MAFSWSKVPNTYLERLASSDLSSLELKIVLAVIRYSIGFNRKHCDRLTLRGVARACDRSWGSHLSAAIDRLIERQVLALEERSDRAGRRRVRIWLRSSADWRLTDDEDGVTNDGEDGVTNEANLKPDIGNPDIEPGGGARPAPSLMPDAISDGAGSRRGGEDVPTQQRQDLERRQRDLDNRDDLRSLPLPASQPIGAEENGKSITEEQELKALIAAMYGREG